MIALDHIIVPVSDAKASVAFYCDILGLKHEGSVGPFEVLRIDSGLTLDLLQKPPRERMHLAFRLSADAFVAAHARLLRAQIPLGSGPFNRSARAPGRTAGATGMLDAFYFDDPDGHNLEIRC
jgi:catechol 2,3-dioxygenase-like lactoylglutathione lyase family enzyme